MSFAGYGEVTLPAPVFTTRVETRIEDGREIWIPRVWAGEGVVFERRYDERIEDWDAEGYASSREDARRRMLEDFSSRMREVLAGG